MASLPSDRVYRGFWTDFSRGDIMGATLTVDSSTATLIVAIISILIPFTGAHLWDIIALAIFSFHATTSPRDAVHHQRQILLRNIASPTIVLFKTLQMCWTWYNHGVRPIRRLIQVILIALTCSLGFLIAGIVSSQIVSSSAIHVLVDSSTCGYLSRQPRRGVKGLNDLENRHLNIAISQSSQYDRTCYNASDADPTCQIFTTQKIPFETTYQDCPFNGMCILDKNPALGMNTGLMSSRDVFGINTRLEDTLSLRKVTTCAPINTSAYEETSPMDEDTAVNQWGRKPLPGEEVIKYHLGTTFFNTSNILKASNYASETATRYSFASLTYHVNGDKYETSTIPWGAGSGFTPIVPLWSDRADVTVAFLFGNSVFLNEPCDDPAFAAHRIVDKPSSETWSNGTRINVTYYAPDSLSRSNGCQEQYQICLPTGECTALSGLLVAAEQTYHFNLTSLQNTTLYSYMNALSTFASDFSSLRNIPRPLFVEDFMRQTNTLYLPENQWEVEVKLWATTMLVSLQRTVAEFATGAGASGERDFDQLPVFPPGPYEHILCHSQKMMAPNGISNISVFGLLFIVAFCGLTTLISLALPRVLRRVSRSKKRDWTFIQTWDEEELLQFQRTAYESNGAGRWRGRLHRIPVTTNNDEFQSLASLHQIRGSTIVGNVEHNTSSCSNSAASTTYTKTT